MSDLKMFWLLLFLNCAGFETAAQNTNPNALVAGSQALSDNNLEVQHVKGNLSGRIELTSLEVIPTTFPYKLDKADNNETVTYAVYEESETIQPSEETPFHSEERAGYSGDKSNVHLQSAGLLSHTDNSKNDEEAAAKKLTDGFKSNDVINGSRTSGNFVAINEEHGPEISVTNSSASLFENYNVVNDTTEKDEGISTMDPNDEADLFTDSDEESDGSLFELSDPTEENWFGADLEEETKTNGPSQSSLQLEVIRKLLTETPTEMPFNLSQYRTEISVVEIVNGQRIERKLQTNPETNLPTDSNMVILTPSVDYSKNLNGTKNKIENSGSYSVFETDFLPESSTISPSVLPFSQNYQETQSVTSTKTSISKDDDTTEVYKLGGDEIATATDNDSFLDTTNEDPVSEDVSDSTERGYEDDGPKIYFNISSNQNNNQDTFFEINKDSIETQSIKIDSVNKNKYDDEDTVSDNISDGEESEYETEGPKIYFNNSFVENPNQNIPFEINEDIVEKESMAIDSVYENKDDNISGSLTEVSTVQKSETLQTTSATFIDEANKDNILENNSDYTEEDSTEMLPVNIETDEKSTTELNIFVNTTTGQNIIGTNPESNSSEVEILSENMELPNDSVTVTSSGGVLEDVEITTIGYNENTLSTQNDEVLPAKGSEDKASDEAVILNIDLFDDTYTTGSIISGYEYKDRILTTTRSYADVLKLETANTSKVNHDSMTGENALTVEKNENEDRIIPVNETPEASIVVEPEELLNSVESNIDFIKGDKNIENTINDSKRYDINNDYLNIADVSPSVIPTDVYNKSDLSTITNTSSEESDSFESEEYVIENYTINLTTKDTSDKIIFYKESDLAQSEDTSTKKNNEEIPKQFPFVTSDTVIVEIDSVALNTETSTNGEELESEIMVETTTEIVLDKIISSEGSESAESDETATESHEKIPKDFPLINSDTVTVETIKVALETEAYSVESEETATENHDEMSIKYSPVNSGTATFQTDSLVTNTETVTEGKEMESVNTIEPTIENISDLITLFEENEETSTIDNREKISATVDSGTKVNGEESVTLELTTEVNTNKIILSEKLDSVESEEDDYEGIHVKLPSTETVPVKGIYEVDEGFKPNNIFFTERKNAFVEPDTVLADTLPASKEEVTTEIILAPTTANSEESDESDSAEGEENEGVPKVFPSNGNFPDVFPVIDPTKTVPVESIYDLIQSHSTVNNIFTADTETSSVKIDIVAAFTETASKAEELENEITIKPIAEAISNKTSLSIGNTSDILQTSEESNSDTNNSKISEARAPQNKNVTFTPYKKAKNNPLNEIPTVSQNVNETNTEVIIKNGTIDVVLKYIYQNILTNIRNRSFIGNTTSVKGNQVDSEEDSSEEDEEDTSNRNGEGQSDDLILRREFVPYVLGKAFKQNINISIKIVAKETTFYVPAYAVLLEDLDNLVLNVTWASSNQILNNSLSLTLTEISKYYVINRVQLNVVRDGKMLIWKKNVVILPKNMDESGGHECVIKFEDGVQVSISNIDFLSKPDVKENENISDGHPPSTSEIKGGSIHHIEIAVGCVAIALMLVVTIYFAVKKAKKRSLKGKNASAQHVAA